jgi:Ni/Co efflux regulator RcnB
MFVLPLTGRIFRWYFDMRRRRFREIGTSMKNLGLAAASLSFLALSCGYAAAQPRNDLRMEGDRPVPPMAEHDHNHADWRRGQRIGHADWVRGAPVDYRARHLRQPPRGYEWREIDGRFVLAAVATGVISDVILNTR